MAASFQSVPALCCTYDPMTDATLSGIQTPSQNTLRQGSVKGNFYNACIQGKTGFIYDTAFLFLSLQTVCLFVPASSNGTQKTKTVK
jgi:hypothetical protein